MLGGGVQQVEPSFETANIAINRQQRTVYNATPNGDLYCLYKDNN